MVKTEDPSQKPKINDLVFKELIKRGYSFEGKTRVWNIADSKLWYLTPEQINDYMLLENTPGFLSAAEDEKILIKETLGEISRQIHNQDFNLIDLGCIHGQRAMTICEFFLSKGLKISYYPVGVSHELITQVEKNFKEKGLFEKVEFKPQLMKIEPFLREKSRSLKTENFKKNVFLLTRENFTNFEPNEILYDVRTGMDSEDVFILTSSVKNQKWTNRTKNFKKRGELDNFIVHTLMALGFKKDEVEFEVRLRNEASEVVYKIKTNKKITNDGRVVEFKKGDKIIVLVSYKHDKKDLLTYLNMNFSEVNTHDLKDKSQLIAICKK
jgi:hypothetical protein